MFVYLRLPQISDYLRMKKLQQREAATMLTQSFEQPYRDLYEVLHRDTHIKLVHRNDRQWLRV